MTVLKYSICSIGPTVNQDVLSAHGGPGSQPTLPRGPHIMPQQPPVTGPPPTSTPNHLATQLMGMNISGQPQPSIQSSVSKLYLHQYFLFSLRCTSTCILFVSSVSQFLSFIGN
jgi:hypothetical protein